MGGFALTDGVPSFELFDKSGKSAGDVLKKPQTRARLHARFATLGKTIDNMSLERHIDSQP
jgi:hypothetical protein